MDKHEYTGERPFWYDGKMVNEVGFCEDFLQKHPMVRVGGSFFTREPLNNSLYPVSTQCISRHLRLVKVISAQNSHYLSTFLLLFLKKGRLSPVSGYGEFSPCHGKRIQIGTSEHGVQSALVFL